MLKNIGATLIAVVLLAGCSSSASKHVGENNSLVAEFEKAAGDRIFFAYDSAALSGEAKETLKNQTAWLKEHKNFSITVEGHCDERGTREYNIALGEKRANAVKHYLVSNGIDAAHIETVSYGKERPAVIGNNEEAWSKNRRGVITLK